MANKAWKGAERRAASLFGTRRSVLSGALADSNPQHTNADTYHPHLFIEVKQRAKHYVFALHLDTARKARKERKVPIVILDQLRSPGQIVCVHTDNLLPFITEYLLANPKDRDFILAALSPSHAKATTAKRLPNRRIRSRRVR